MRALAALALLASLPLALPAAADDGGPPGQEIVYVGPASTVFGQTLADDIFACDESTMPVHHGYPGACFDARPGTTVRLEILDATGLPVAGLLAWMDEDGMFGAERVFCGATEAVVPPTPVDEVRVYPLGAAETMDACAMDAAVGATAGRVRRTTLG